MARVTQLLSSKAEIQVSFTPKSSVLLPLEHGAYCRTHADPASGPEAGPCLIFKQIRNPFPSPLFLPPSLGALPFPVTSVLLTLSLTTMECEGSSDSFRFNQTSLNLPCPSSVLLTVSQMSPSPFPGTISPFFPTQTSSLGALLYMIHPSWHSTLKCYYWLTCFCISGLQASFYVNLIFLREMLRS